MAPRAPGSHSGYKPPSSPPTLTPFENNFRSTNVKTSCLSARPTPGGAIVSHFEPKPRMKTEDNDVVFPLPQPIVMIDFGHRRLRRDDEDDQAWKEAKWDEVASAVLLITSLDGTM
ncbi:hypothetical protein RSAG8_04225, partial [Rhizoctonia solani AG-8 WAC10335]